MKKIFLTLIIGAMLALSCKKYPDLSALSDEYLVQTNYDATIDFKTRYAAPDNTYYMPDTIRIISDNPNDTIWIDYNAEKVLYEIESMMKSYGYDRINDPSLKNSANIGVMVSYIKDLKQIFYYDSNWWWYYPSYWKSGSWGWLPWYYPYNFMYTYATGSLVIEMVDPKYDPQLRNKSAVVWNMYAAGVLSRLDLKNATRGVTAVNQAFIQSDYLNLK